MLVYARDLNDVGRQTESITGGLTFDQLVAADVVKSKVSLVYRLEPSTGRGELSIAILAFRFRRCESATSHAYEIIVS
jgi:hypothetical protein